MSLLRQPDVEPIPGYRLIEPLGNGGFGEVWKCEAPGGIFKAIKFVFGNLNSFDVEGARAEQELHALEQVREIRHPFVLSLDRIEIVEGQLVIVMELADKSLHDHFMECQTAGLVGIPRDTLLRYIRDTAEALDHMNEKHNLQHLDIKPRNLFLVSDRVKVADFGLVKHIERANAEGMLGGVTPLYASPETFSGKVSGRSDQYSLAIVYQELLTGQRPFNGKNVRQLAQQHLQEEPELRALPEAERPIVARALAKDPAKRYPNCLAFVRALYAARAPARPEHVIADTNASKNEDSQQLADLELELLSFDKPTAKDRAGGRVQGDHKKGGNAPGEAEMSQLGLTVAQPQTGALRPTLLIGLGGFGRQVLQELRCRMLDRFGPLNRIPLMRFLYVDIDAEALKASTRGEPEMAFSNGEIHHLPLQPIGHYRRRQLDQIYDWLPREKLYALPRSLQTQGSRALGRLAFSDNYLRLLARLKREIQEVTHPDAIYRAVTETGLALRDNVPRIYVIVSAGGGSSGCLVDLGYTLRRLLQQMRHADATVTAILMCGAPANPATPRAEQANIYATLTELHHFADPAVSFTAQYGTDGPRIVDQQQPFDSAYVVTCKERTPQDWRETMTHLGSYLFHDLTTPLGLRLDRCRQMPQPPDATPFRSLGTYGVWFPRGLLLRLAARRACCQIVAEWQSPSDDWVRSALRADVESACVCALADPELRPESLAISIERAACSVLDDTPAAALAGLLAQLEEQSQHALALEDPGNWARQAVTRVREWLGAGLGNKAEGGNWCKSKLGKALEKAVHVVAEEWDKRLAEVYFGLMDLPGKRMAAAEVALDRLTQFCDEAAQAHLARLEQQSLLTQQSWEHLQAALNNCVANSSGFGFFGGRGRRSLKVFMEHLAAFARQCLVEDSTDAVQRFFANLRSKLDERQRDLAFCRQRLRYFQELLSRADDGDKANGLACGADDLNDSCPSGSASALWESMQKSQTARVVLPDGQTDLSVAADRFLERLGQEEWSQLDQVLQEQVVEPLGGMHHVCVGNSELLRNIVRPLLEQAASYLGEHLPVTDVAQVQFSIAQGLSEEVMLQAQTCFANAAPLVSGQDPAQQYAFLLIPASEAGKAYGDEAVEAVPGLQPVLVPGQADLMFCREQGYLRPAEVEVILRPCRSAYQEAARQPNTSPHARFDLTDWIPLDP